MVIILLVLVMIEQRDDFIHLKINTSSTCHHHLLH